MTQPDLQPIVVWQKTDLNLLLECLKYQMDSPATQKQALITIHSICQQNSEASDYFREIGGVQFVNGLIKLSDAPILREAALFTLGALAESSVYCQQSLCTAELLSDVALSLAQEGASLILKRMNVYMILVLVSHNKIGQTLARTTGCIDVLLNLFRWSALTGESLVLPVNRTDSKLVFELACTGLLCVSLSRLSKMKTYVQDYFCKVGGLDAVAQTLVRLVDESIRHHSSTELAISVVKTLNSCISENPPVVSHLSEYFIVPKLVALLLQNDLDISSKLGIILAIGHCTDGCDLIDTEINSTLTSPAPSLNAGQDFRCSGCSTVAASLNSRNFCKILQLCPNKCDRHKVIQECEDRYKRELKKLLNCYSSMTDKKNLLTPIKKATSHMTNFHTRRTDFLIMPKSSTKDFHTKKILLTPIQKTASQMTNYRRQQTDFITWPKTSTKDIHVKRFLLTPMKKSASGGAAFRLRKDDTIQFKPTMGQEIVTKS
ncbi:telomere repeats-binding bouquet formation protein 1 [Rhincodon typus]|uniref:telomere repeats-binding bouquet formation protein 1 n=1 Tax=Rhincodon typus TaxID=259920 RepID=UPI00202FF338|nr:telomere repeats-binding bouquet formation protein 1 [Rhincodon typus]